MVQRLCHAKINLALAVGPPIPPGRPDAGMHPVCSWMARVDLFDTLRIRRAKGAGSTYRRLHADGRTIDWPEEQDLAARAHRALESRVGRPLPIDLELIKRIPAGGGLGGGSADAAGVLFALRELFALDQTTVELAQVGAALGSDIAFFMDDQPGPAIVSGLGQQVERVGALDAPLALVLPPFGCPTGAVYRAFDALAPARGFDEAAARVRRSAAAGDLTSLFNDLLPAAETVRPDLLGLRRDLEDATGRAVHLSGSGSTLFLVGPDAEALARIVPACRVIATRTL